MDHSVKCDRFFDRVSNSTSQLIFKKPCLPGFTVTSKKDTELSEKVACMCEPGLSLCI